MRVLVCSHCGKEFQYSKRGRTPKRPVCPECSVSPELTQSRSESQSRSANTQPRPEGRARKLRDIDPCSPKYQTDSKGNVRYFIYRTKIGCENLHEGQYLYWIPKKIVLSEKRLHTDGRVVEFVRCSDSGKVIVRVCRKEKRKEHWEEYETKLENLGIIERVEWVPASEVWGNLIFAGEEDGKENREHV